MIPLTKILEFLKIFDLALYGQSTKPGIPCDFILIISIRKSIWSIEQKTESKRQAESERIVP